MLEDKKSPEYRAQMLADEWLWDIDKEIWLSVNNNKTTSNSILELENQEENIEDIEDNIDIIEDDSIIKFMFEWKPIWIIEYTKAKNNEIYIDLIANINATQKYFEKYDLIEKYNFKKLDFQIKWLVYFMYKYFFENLKERWFNTFFCIVENEKIFSIYKNLEESGIIKNQYTRINNNEIEELVNEV